MVPTTSTLYDPKAGISTPTPPSPTIPAPTADQLANRTAEINRPVLTPPGTPTTPTGAPTVPAPRSADDIYDSYVKGGQKILDSINAAYDNAVKAATAPIDAAAGKDQQSQNALAAASGLLGSSAAVAGSSKIAGAAADKKSQIASDLRGKQATDIANYLSQLQTAAQTQANEEKTTYPTLDTYYKSQAGNAFKGLAASGVDWDKLSTQPDYQSAYNSIVSAFGGDPSLAKLAFISASKDSTQSQYTNQDPIQTADGNWIFFKQVTQPDGSIKIVPDSVDVGSYLAPGDSLATLGGKPYAVTKGADGTLTYKPIDTTTNSAAAGFTLGSDQQRYELNPTTGKYELVAATGAAPGSGGSKILSVTEAQSLGVPYGTTQEQAYGKSPGQDTVTSLAQQLVQGNLAPSELSKRATGSVSYNDVLKAADDYSMATYGKHFSIAQADRDYKFAVRPQTQDTLNYLGSLIGSDDGTGNITGGNMDELVTLSNDIGRTNFPAINDAAAWARFSAGDPKIAEFQSVATEVADQVAKILQGGGNAGTSDAKLQQAVNLFNTSFSKAQLVGVVNSLKPLLTNRAKSMVKDNRYLSDYADQFGIPQQRPSTVGNSKEYDAAGSAAVGSTVTIGGKQYKKTGDDNYEPI